MKLRRIAVRHFKKLVDPLVIDDLGDGLTVIAGDNEEGKSTLLAALKAGLFDTASLGGREREAMTPHGGGTPEVEVGFELGGRRYDLAKTFKRGGARLVHPAGRAEGEEAERRLLEVLRFERPGRGAAKPEHHGLQAVFWVDQATSFDHALMAERLSVGGERFKSAIEREVGGLALGARGRQVLERAREKRADYFGASNKPRGAFARALEAVAALEADAQALRTRLQAFDARRAELENRRADRRRFQERDELAHAGGRVEAARLRLAEAEAAGREAELAASRMKEAQSTRAQAEAALLNRQNLQDSVKAAAARIAALQDELAAARLVGEGAKAAVAAAEQAIGLAQAEEAAGARRVERARLAREHAGLAERLARLETAARSLDKEAASVQALQAGLARHRLDAAGLKRLRTLEDAALKAQIALDASATVLAFDPDPGRTVTAGTQPVDPAVPLRLTEERTLTLAGFGRLTVTPGGEALATRRDAATRTAHALSNALEALNLADMAAAAAALQARADLERALQAARLRIATSLEAQGFETLAHLQEAAAALRLEVLDLAARLDAAGPADAAPLPDLAALRARLEAARLAMREAEQRLTAAQIDEARTASVAETARRDHDDLKARLDREAQARDLPALAGAAEAAALAERAAALVQSEQERRTRQLDPAAARDALAMAERQLAALHAERDRLDRIILEIESQLRGGGDAALGEALAEAEGRLELARHEAAARTREAEAWRLLAGELEAAAAEVETQLIEPVQARLRPYLARLFADAELALDPATLMPLSLQRAGQSDPFQNLSVGTREQIAILVRLALGRLLQDREGEAPCLILDDALVYADEGRFERMKAILQRAAKDQQIIVLTCRPRDYLGLEGAMIRLEECRAPA